jgi:hypothetical protein
VETLLGARTGGLTDGVSTDRRPIASPIRLGELAAGATPADPSPEPATQLSELPDSHEAPMKGPK